MKEKKKGISISGMLIIAGVLIIAVIAGVLIHNQMSKKEKEEEASQSAEGTEGEELTPEELAIIIPYGDTEDDFDFSGEYKEMTSDRGTITMQKDGETYAVNIKINIGDTIITTWTMSAKYDKNRKTLRYTDCKRTDYVGDESSATVEYTDGTGYLYIAEEKLFWMDEKEDSGAGLLFEKAK